jgi:hypothetical protein
MLTIVNNSNVDITLVMPFFLTAYHTGILPLELEDLFTIQFVTVKGHKRMIIDLA